MSKMTWGDTVRIKKAVSSEYRPGAFAAVCGMRAVESKEIAAQFKCEIGTILYLVEFSDGNSIELPESWLEVATGND